MDSSEDAESLIDPRLRKVEPAQGITPAGTKRNQPTAGKEKEVIAQALSDNQHIMSKLSRKRRRVDSEDESQDESETADQPRAPRSSKMTKEDYNLIALGNASLTHLERNEKAPDVWSKRGVLSAGYKYLLDFAYANGLWTPKQMKVMLNGKDADSEIRFRKNKNLFNAKGQVRKRSQKMLVDARNLGGKFERVLDAPESRALSQAAYDDLVVLQRNKLKGSKDPTGKPKRIKAERQSLMDLTESTQDMAVMANQSEREALKVFRRERAKLEGKVKTLEEEVKSLKQDKVWMELRWKRLLQWLKDKYAKLPAYLIYGGSDGSEVSLPE